MPKKTIKLGRKYPKWRISAYECEINLSGTPTIWGRYIGRGWYGLFNLEKLKNEIMPKLIEYAKKGYSYPFLITQHEIEEKAKIDINPPKDLKFYPREKQSGQTWVAVVLGPRKYKILTT